MRLMKVWPEIGSVNVIVTVMALLTAETCAEKFPRVAPAGTVTLDGTETTVGALLESL